MTGEKNSGFIKESTGDILLQYGKIAAGCFLFAISVNLFVVPTGMYNGGIYGFSQIIRTLLMKYSSLAIPAGFDISGIINLILNIPLFYIAYRYVSKQFFFRTLFCVNMQTVMLSIIPIPSAPILNEMLPNCLIGGLIAGYGIGLMLRSKGSSGGVDILGMYFLRHNNRITVGQLSIIVNAVIYTICALMFDINVACYSVMYASIISFTMDKTHYQNINMLCFIISKDRELQYHLTKALGRGVTYWNGKGAFLDEDRIVQAIVISKHEVKDLKRVINSIDPDAFVFMSEGITVDGYYLKKL